MMKPIIPLSEPLFRGRETEYVLEALHSGWVSGAGAFVSKFEREVASLVGTTHAIALCNGTSALHIALQEMGVKAGEEVILPTVTFIAPVNTVKYVGAEPVFMDCDQSLNISVDKVATFLKNNCRFKGEKLINKTSGREVKGIVAVHVFGHPANMEQLLDIAQQYNLFVIEDASEALGSYFCTETLKNRYAGAVGSMGCFSFNGNKIITAGGGGMIVTNDEKKAYHIRYLIAQAKDDDIYYVHDEIGYNYKFSNLQAALGLAQLENLREFIKIKRNHFHYYKNELEGYNGLTLIDEPAYAFSNFWLNSLVVDAKTFGFSRDQLMTRLRENSIISRPLWRLNHLQRPFRQAEAFAIERAAWFADRILNIPSSIGLTQGDLKRVVAAIRGIC